MPIQVGGVKFTISVGVGGSTRKVQALGTSLNRLRGEINLIRSGFAYLQRILGSSANAYLAMKKQLDDIRTTLVSLNKGLNTNTRAVNDVAKATNTLANAQTQIATRTQRTYDRVRVLSQRLRRLKKDTVEAKEATDAFGAGLQTFVGARVIRYLVDFLKSSTLLAGRVQNLDTIMRTVGSTANLTGGEIKFVEGRMKQLGITTQAARIIITKFAQNNLEMAKSLRIARIAQDAAVVAGTNSSIAAEKITIAIQRLDTRLLRNQGILINLRNEYKRFALATGRAENSLTAAEKQQITMNAVLREGAALAGAYESALQDVFKQYTSLDRKIEEATVSFGSNFIPVFQVLVNLTDVLTTQFAAASKSSLLFNEAVGAVTGGIIGAGLAGAIGLLVVGIGTLVTLLGTAAAPLLALGAVIGGLAGYVSSYTAALVNMRKARDADIEQMAFQSVRIQKLSKDLEDLNGVTNKTAQVELEQAAIRREILELLTQEERVVAANTASYEEFLVVVSKFARLGSEIGAGVDKQLVELKNRETAVRLTLDAMSVDIEESLKQSKVVFDEYRTQFHQTQFIEARTRDFMRADAQHFLELLKDIQVAQDQIVANMRSQRLQELEALEKLSETAVQLAGDVLGKLENRELKRMTGENVKEFYRLVGVVKDLSGSYLTYAQIQQQLADRDEEAKAKLLPLIEEKRAFIAELEKEEEVTSELIEAKDALQEQEEKLRQALAANAGAAEDAMNRTQTIIDAMLQANELLRERVDSAQLELTASLEKLSMLQSGLAEEAVDAYQKMRIESREATVSINAQRDAIQGIIASIKQQQEVLDTNTAKDPEGVRNNIEQLQERLRLARELLGISIELAKVNSQTTFESFLSEMGASQEAYESLLQSRLDASERARMIEEGATEDIADLLMERAELERKASDEIKQQVEARRIMQARMVEIDKETTEAIKNGVDTRNLTDELYRVDDAYERSGRIIRELQEKLKDDLIANEKDIFEAKQEFNEKAVEEAKKAAKAISDEQRKTFEEAARNVEKAAGDLQKQLSTIQQQKQRTADFLIGKRFDIFGERFGGEKELTDIFRDFSGAVGGAGDADQLKVLEQFFVANVQKLQQDRFRRGDAQGAMAIGQVANGLLQNLQADIQRRQVEIQRRDAEFELAKKRFDQAQKQALLDVERLKVEGQLKDSMAKLVAFLQNNPGLPGGNGVAAVNPFQFGIGDAFAGALRGAGAVARKFGDLGTEVENMAAGFAEDLSEQEGAIGAAAKGIGSILKKREREKTRLDNFLGSLGLK